MNERKEERIFVSGPSITEKEIAYVREAVETAWYANANVFHDRFEKAFAEYLGVKHAVTLPSCTSAIHLALAALGVGPGDEVIVPDATWIASSAPITYVGATPIFADVDPVTWCIDRRSVEQCMTERTKAIIAVDLYGGMPDMDGLRRSAKDRGVAIIEDAAEAIGSEYRGAKAGTLGDVGVFSFHGSKTLTTGEGGMLVTDRDDLFDRVMVLRDHGRTPGDIHFFNGEIAFKYKVSSMQAALGLAQLERVEDLVRQKRKVFRWYAEALADVQGVSLNAEPAGTLNTYWMVTALFDPGLGVKKEQVMAGLSEKNIDSRPFFHPLSSLPAYAAAADTPRARKRNVVSYAICPYGVNLPSGLDMTESKVARVADALKKLVAAT